MSFVDYVPRQVGEYIFICIFVKKKDHLPLTLAE